MTPTLAIFIVAIVLFLDDCSAKFKSVHLTVNRDCPGNCSSRRLFHVQSIGCTNIINYVWDFGDDGKPVLLIADASLNTQLFITWKDYSRYKTHSIRFSESPSYILGIVVNNLYEFDDKNNVGIEAADERSFKKFDVRNWSWNHTLDIIEYRHVSSIFDGHRANEEGQLRIKIYAFSMNETAPDLQRYFHSENTSRVDITLSDFNASYEQSRFAVELIIFSTTKASSRLKMFRSNTVIDPDAPDVHGSNSITLEDAVEIVESDLKTFMDVERAVNGTLMNAFFNASFSNLTIRAVNITFGGNGESYRQTNITSWALLLGVGKMPIREVSSFVYWILGFIIGLPSLTIVIGACYILFRRV